LRAGELQYEMDEFAIGAGLVHRGLHWPLSVCSWKLNLEPWDGGTSMSLVGAELITACPSLSGVQRTTKEAAGQEVRAIEQPQSHEGRSI
jgi:hypothetical protein